MIVNSGIVVRVQHKKEVKFLNQSRLIQIDSG